MNQKIKLAFYFILTTLFITIGCSSDDDAITVVSLQDLEITLDENPTEGQPVGTVQSADGTAFEFSITSQSPSGALNIDSDSGELTVADASLFDFEANPTLTATINADNAANTVKVTINLNNLNEVSAQAFEATIDENPTEGQVVGSIQTSGAATGFSIATQSHSGALAIDSSSGQLTVADASLFDFETNATISATVMLEDAANPVLVTVNLDNVLEVTIQDFSIAMDENPADAQVIGTLQTSGGTAASFSITSQTPVGAISIDPATGEITVADSNLFDFETNSTISATVSEIDAENPATVTINLNDVVELIAQDLSTDMDENPTDGQIVGTIQANGSGTLSFSITSQTPTGALSIDASTGELSVIDPNLFDYEANPVITATILVDDGAETATATATINLNDVDEVAAQNTDITIDENPSNGDVVGALQASGSNLSYTITYQNPAAAFNIDQNTGELSVADETLFDFETNPNMLATISVSNGTQSVSANAFVTLGDLNEVGEYKFGGVIFWVNPTGDEGLVVALTNQSSSSTWGCSGILTGAAGATIGTGETNTTAIISAGCATPGTAAELVSNLSLNGYDDWFLPSSDEWIEVYNNLSIIQPVILSNGGDDFLIQYWSSTENDAYNAEFIVFSGPAAGTIYSSLNKTSDVVSTRAIRAWTDF